MQIIDSFLHPLLEPSEDNLFSISNSLLINNLNRVKSQMSLNNIIKGNIILFNSGLLKNLKLNFKKDFYFSILADFRDNNNDHFFDILAKKQIKSIVFHPYLQNIKSKDWNDCLSFAKKAENSGLIITICTAYGSKKIYDIDVLPFSLFITKNINSPIIFSHCGGLKILDAMLISENFDNIYFDTSFSLSYWLGSSVEQDLAFVINKIGINRFLFGSDFPFISMKKSIEDHFSFFDRWKFSFSEIECMMNRNALQLYDRV